jgi:hypothetical protein
MKTIKFSLAATLLATLSLAQAAGPLQLTDHPTNPQPMRWDTSKPVQVYTDIGVYTYRNDGSVFLTNEQADRITAFALKQWSDVATSTWRAVTDPTKFKKFDQVASIGVDVVDGATASKIYGQYNEGGMYVIYDQYGKVIEEIFGAPKDQVLGIAFAEMAEDRDGDGYPETITKATAVMNGYVVSHEPADPANFVEEPDVDGKRIAGVFTHEFGHAINMSHSQTNGQLGYFSQNYPGYELYPGVKGCVAPVFSSRATDTTGGSRLEPKFIETMFPFIDPTSYDPTISSRGMEMSTVDRPDDIAAISDLYPTTAYSKTRGSIAGTLFLKDGRTPYSGINIIARNVNNPLGDAISAMSGDKTQGRIGPDGRFRINNLTPGQKYFLYTEEIYAGGYPTEPQMLVSEAEYWNIGEQANAAKDKPCNVSYITAEAGVTKTANFYFNGYNDGVQYTPLTYGYLGSMSKDGERAAGTMDNIPFVWDSKTGITMAPAGVVGVNASITRDGRKLIVQTSQNGKDLGIDEWTGLQTISNRAGIWDTRTGTVTDLGDLNGNTCFSGSQTGYASSYGWALSGLGTTAVGTAFIDRNHDGGCEGSWSADGTTYSGGEIIPFIWDARGKMRQLSMKGVDTTTEFWHRAHNVSGDGRVVVGTSNMTKAYAWIDEGKPIDLFKVIGAVDGGYAMTPDASRVVLSNEKGDAIFWNARRGTDREAFSKPAALKWCKDFPFLDFGLSCETYEGGAAAIERDFGSIPVFANDISDDGKVMVARVGSFFESGMHGMLWLEDLGWIKLTDFFRTQGVAEAYRFGLDGPGSVNGKGNLMVGGIPGYPLTWYVDMKRAFVCKRGRSIETDFPTEFVEQVKDGAQMGRCEHLK